MRRLITGTLAAGVALAITGGTLLYAQSPQQLLAGALGKDNAAVGSATTGLLVRGYDGTNAQFLSVSSAGSLATAGTQVVPTASQVACTDNGHLGSAISFTANAADVRLEITNTSVDDVCISWGTAGAPDRTDLSTCSFVLGANGGGTSEVYITPADVQIGGEAFECDGAASVGGSSKLMVTAWRVQ